MNRLVLQIGKKDFESFLALKNCLVVNGKEHKKHEEHYKKGFTVMAWEKKMFDREENVSNNTVFLFQLKLAIILHKTAYTLFSLLIRIYMIFRKKVQWKITI